MYIDAEQLKAHLLKQLNADVDERKQLNPLTPEYAYTSGSMQAYAKMLDWLNDQPKHQDRNAHQNPRVLLP